MLNIFTLANGRLFQEEIESLEELTKFQPIWVDLESPTVEEKRWIKQHYELSIPEDAMDDDIEAAAKVFVEGVSHATRDYVTEDDSVSVLQDSDVGGRYGYMRANAVPPLHRTRMHLLIPFPPT